MEGFLFATAVESQVLKAVRARVRRGVAWTATGPDPVKVVTDDQSAALLWACLGITPPNSARNQGPLEPVSGRAAAIL